MARCPTARNLKSSVESRDWLELVDCNQLETIIIESNNISKENVDANVSITDLQSLKTLVIGSNSCKNVFLFQLGRELLFRVFDDRSNDVEIVFGGRVRVL